MKESPFRLWVDPFLCHWKMMSLGSGLALLAVMAAVGLLSLSGWFITAAAVAGAAGAGLTFNFFYPSIGVRLLAVSRTLARYAERLMSHDATFRILAHLRTAFYRRLEPAAPACILKYRSGDLLQRLVGDIDTLDHLYLRLLSPCAVAAATTAGLLLFLGVYNRPLAFAAAGILATAAIGVSLTAGIWGPDAGRQITRVNAHLRTRIVEGVQGMAELLVFGASHRYGEGIRRAGEDLVNAQRRMSRISALANALSTLFSGTALAVVLWLGAVQVRGKGLRPEELALAAFAVLASFEVVFPLAGAFQFLGRTRSAMERLQEVAAAEPAVVFDENSSANPEGFDLVFDGVCFEYGEGQTPVVLKGASLAIAQGQRLALMGATGAGKSTLVHLLCRFWDPTGGRILIGGVDIRKLREEALRRCLSVVSQRAHLFSGTIRENLSLARPAASEAELFRALEATGLGDFVRSLPEGIDTWIGEHGRRISGGQARRLVVARAVLHDAPVWVLDEPTEGLDQKSEEALLDTLMALTEKKTVLLISHRSAGLDRFDQVVMLEEGKIVRVVTPDEMAKG